MARSIAAGQRGHRLRPTRTDTELGATAAAFDEMLDELEGAESRAQRAEERSRSFLADAAHELRTPITGLQAAAEILLQQGSDLEPAQRERLQVLLIMEAQRAGKLVADLLATSRLDTGVDLELAPVSLAGLVAAELDRARLLHPGVALGQHGDDAVIMADGGKVAEIVRNLLDNALRACGPHGRVAIVLSPLPAQVALEVVDSGAGVRRADRERIFERLVRLDHARSSDAGGSGLGLAIARGYARAHGGELTCEEPPNGWGARFRLVLPQRTDLIGSTAAAPTRAVMPAPQNSAR
jgi:two-component system, OmpR family, sensor kinase